MTNNNKNQNKVDEKEVQDVSEMVDEGGLGADNYYGINEFQPNGNTVEVGIDQFKLKVSEYNDADLVNSLIAHADANHNEEKFDEAINIIKQEVLGRLHDK
ncbi:hypothetical protein QVA72_09015 [Staphylococcus simulans]|uniref:Uncharacterized protein n=2 Tax=Staphylococcus simulans TaxID=1286 RepID=A0A6N2ZPT3_STASI|nr:MULTISPECIES: hypothetical protein [Staphylococcus]MBO0386764.1 hypothetical protein [Staphylococcus simulans]MBU6942876.1 hypothetical protein [Staphylococcus sp. CWZ226]MDN6233496.1 hypothetical protein [Staphylococcus simulans]MDQ7116127.1 hypothetical protein [Staphylococcus simulans]MDQ7139536.1 hypothetical protein [Staphylococcus simulans]